MDWTKIRTCSQVSSGRCNNCSRETYYEAYRRDTELLCSDCYEDLFLPEKAAERKAVIEKSKADSERDLALALEGKLSGAIIQDNGTVLGPVRTLFGLPYRQVLRIGSFDNIRVDIPPPDGSLTQDIYKSYLDSIKPESPD